MQTAKRLATCPSDKQETPGRRRRRRRPRARQRTVPPQLIKPSLLRGNPNRASVTGLLGEDGVGLSGGLEQDHAVLEAELVDEAAGAQELARDLEDDAAEA